MCPADSKRVIREQRLGFAATVRPDRSPRTVKNLRANPAIAVNVADPIRMGYRFTGRAAVADRGEPEHPARRCCSLAPPASLLLIHGAGSGPWVFGGWAQAFPGITVACVDLHAGIDVSRASHEDYAGIAARAAKALPQPTSLCGWSMGGLVVLQASQRVSPHSVILLEPSPPAEVQGLNPAVEIKNGT